MKKIVKITIFVLFIGFVFSCEKEEPIEEEPIEESGIVEEKKNETISASSGGKIETSTGVKIEVPVNAIKSDKNITVEIVDPNLEENEDKIPDGLKGEKVSAVVRCGPEGTVFETPVKVTIPFYPELLHEELSTDDIFVVSYSGDSLELLPFTIDRVNNVVVAEASHFSDFAVVTNLFEYEGRIYKTTIIDGKEWMAENFAYLPKLSQRTSKTNPTYAVDFLMTETEINEAKETEFYKKCGVFYNWPAAIEACPEGWHLPTKAEWEQLIQFVNTDNGGFTPVDGLWFDNFSRYFKTTSGWTINGSDDYGFSAIPTYKLDANDQYSEFTEWWGSDFLGLSSKGDSIAVSFMIFDQHSRERYFLFINNETETDIGASVRYIKDN